MQPRWGVIITLGIVALLALSVFFWGDQLQDLRWRARHYPGAGPTAFDVVLLVLALVGVWALVRTISGRGDRS